MTIANDYKPARAVNSLTEADTPKAHAYIQGAVYCWCKNKPEESFAIRDFFGDVNADWGGTPLQAVYNHWRSVYKKRHPELNPDKLHKKAARQAAIDVGWLAKFVLQNDRREFESFDAGGARGYKWVGGN